MFDDPPYKLSLMLTNLSILISSSYRSIDVIISILLFFHTLIVIISLYILISSSYCLINVISSILSFFIL